MDYQEIANIWNHSDLNIEENSSIRQELLKEVSVNKIKSQLYEIKWGSYFEILFNMVWIGFLIPFILTHFQQYQFALPALLLLMIAGFSFYIKTKKLIHFYSLIANDSVLETQTRLEKLRRLEHIDLLSLYFIIPLFAAPFLIVTAYAFLGIDIYAYSPWLLSLSAGSILIGLVIVFILKKFPNKGLKESLAFLKDLDQED